MGDRLWASKPPWYTSGHPGTLIPPTYTGQEINTSQNVGDTLQAGSRGRMAPSMWID